MRPRAKTLLQGVQPPLDSDRNISLLADHCAMHADATDSSAYVNSAAHADLWCGPGSAKIAIKHFFSNATSKTEVSICIQSISFCCFCFLVAPSQHPKFVSEHVAHEKFHHIVKLLNPNACHKNQMHSYLTLMPHTCVTPIDCDQYQASVGNVFVTRCMDGA